MAEYDKFAKEYTESVSLKKKYAMEPTFFRVLGDISGCAILDVACGSGYFTRKLKQLGAGKTVGVDISIKMIELALEEEKRNSLGIKYLKQDAIKLEKLGEFDLVTGTFLLHYAQTKDELRAMIDNCYKNVKPGGRFVAINQDPEYPFSSNKKLGTTVTFETKDLKEGDGLRLTTYDKEGNELSHFINYFWEKETYNKFFAEAGFKKVIWHEMELIPEAFEDYSEEFWQDFEKEKSIVIIECFK